MKKVLIILSLSGLLSILLSPVIASVAQAAECASSCNAPVTVDCKCGQLDLTGGTHYCWNKEYAGSKEECLKIKGGGSVAPSGATKILGLQDPLGEGTTFETLLNKIINFIFWVGMAAAPVMFIVAGFLYVTSAGNPQKVESAKKMIIYAVIGLAVLLLAKGLVKVLESVIGVPKNP